ncbi:hypothetical protein [Oleidesulfovibrio sp.]
MVALTDPWFIVPQVVLLAAAAVCLWLAWRFRSATDNRHRQGDDNA